MCFVRHAYSTVLRGLESRFKMHLSDEQAVDYMLRLIRKSINHFGTNRYDNFQFLSNGIYP